MKKVILLIVATLLVIPVFSFLAPQIMLSLRESEVSEKYRGDSRETLSTLGRGLTGEKADEPSPIAYCLSTSVSDDFPRRKLVALSLVGFKFPVARPAADETLEETSLSPEALETAEVAALEASERTDPSTEFLARQAVFADHSIPQSVDCAYEDLPFDHVMPVSAEITSVFGYRVHPVYGDVRFHYGTDFDVVDGDDVYSFASGTVTTAGTISGYGLTLIIDHGGGYTTLYGHCSELLVSAGDTVEAGQLVAHSGHSGLVTGPHMHFELRHNDKYLNPEYYI